MPSAVAHRPPEQSKPFRDVPYHLHRKLVEYLDVQERWRRVIDVMPMNSYTTEQVERMAMAIHRHGGSPAHELLIDLGIRGFTVEQLVCYLKKLSYEAPLLLLLPREGVKILSHPRSVVCSVGGDIVLEVTAFGLPFPRYQWYNMNKEAIPSACDSVLRIPKAGVCHRGIYCVNVYNEDSHVFSDWCEVKIVETPRLPVSMPPSVMPFWNTQDTSQPMHITCQPPRELRYYEGEMVKIQCRANGPTNPLEYEWLKDDSTLVKSAQSTLVIPRAKTEDSGTYKCKVTCPVNDQVLFSSVCQLTIDARSPINPEYIQLRSDKKTRGRSDDYEDDRTGGRTGISSPVPVQVQKLCGKVALVIGNQRYYGSMTLSPLYQAESDAAEIASLLTSIDDDFRVISLINLTGHEMNAAITYFISLLDSGVYGVFYFAGHGFELNGESYLLPVDVGLENGPEQIIRALDILYKMQKQRAKFSLMMLDVCRTEYPPGMHDLIARLPTTRPPRTNVGNYIQAHSCCSQHMAFERRSEQNGIYVSHLKRFLANKETVEEVLRRVAKSIADSCPETIQRPAYESTTVEPISLHDKIEYIDVSEHKNYAKLLDSWQQSHQVPRHDEPLYHANGVKIELSFQAEFSNVLIVCLHADFANKKEVEQLSIAVEVDGPDADAVNVEDLTEKPGSREAYKQVTNLHVRPKLNAPWSYRLCDIQKLRDTLCLKFKIRYMVSSSHGRVFWEEEKRLTFPAPLVANLNLQSRTASMDAAAAL